MTTLMGSVGRGGSNRPDDVGTVQTLLNHHRNPPMSKLTVSRMINEETVNAIQEFQRRVLHMHTPDGRVDPHGRTLAALNAPAVPGANAMVGLINIKVSHGNKLPTGVTGLPGANVHTTSSRYESSLTISGGLSGTFKCSIYPDNMNVKGRLKDGMYNIHLGFHKAGAPTAQDLVVRTNGFRAVLVVNANQSVPVQSNLATKTTSNGIHIHNGYNSWTAAHPMSEGCVILHPSDWSGFIKKFLDKFTNIDDWKCLGDRVGKKLGTLTIGA